MSSTINKNKTFFKNLVNIFGIGNTIASVINYKIGLNGRNNPKRIKKKHFHEFEKIKKNIISEKRLKNHIKEIKFFEQKIKTYKSLRNKLNLPCRGQRTHTNAKTKKKIKVYI